MVMKKSFLIPSFLTLALAALFLYGCKKENSNDLSDQEEEQAATFSTESENESGLVFNDVFDNVMGVSNEVGLAGTGVFGRVGSGRPGSSNKEMEIDSVHCFTVTTTRLNPPDLFPVRIVINFGNGCTGNDGHTRYGKIIIVYTGRLTIPGKSATATFDGFKLDSIAVEGTHTVTNTTASGSNQRQFTVDVANGKLTKPGGNFVEWTSHQVITQVEGNGTPDLPLDDVFTVTGNGHGKLRRGNLLVAWQSEIIEPLRKRFNCHWISKGILKVRRETLPVTSPWVALLNFGNGDCDFAATLTINGVAHQIQLPH
jgi:hypothetical protein